MKILFWTDGFWPRLGGVETMGYRFIEEMQKKGHQFMVIAQKDHPSWMEEEAYQAIPIRRFDFNSIIAKRDLSHIRSIREYLESILRNFQPDLIHLYANCGGSALAFLFFERMFSIPVLLTSIAPYKYENKLATYIEKIAIRADKIFCISDWVLKEMERAIPSIKHKLKLIYLGLPQPKIPPSPLSFSPPTLLLFGRLSWEKGFSVGIEAFSLLKKSGSNAQLIIAGGGVERPKLEQLVDKLEVRESVVFKGILKPEEVAITLNRATLVLVPSILESFGLVILEAMQMERPVIASRTEGIPEVVSDQTTGLLVPMQDPEALFVAIQTLLQDPQKAIEMGRQGRKKATHFTIEQHALEYENAYNELVGKKYEKSISEHNPSCF